MRKTPIALAPKTPVPVPTATTLVQSIPLDLIDPSPTQPRQAFDDDGLRELAASIQQHGVLQPIIVRPRDGRLEVVAGERRVRASRLAGLPTIPAQVRDLDDRAVRKVQIVENLQRENVHPLDEADAFQALLDDDPACTPEVIAVMVGKSRPYVYRCLTYRRLIPEARAAFARNALTAAHAARLAQVPPAEQPRALEVCFLPILARQSGDGDALDARSLAPVRQLDAWIEKHVKLDAHGQDTQELLPELAAQVAGVESAEHGMVLPLSTLHFHTDKRDPVPILAQSWRHADGKEQCKHARSGVIVLGEGRGTLLKVCVAKKKCERHWPARRTTAGARQREAAIVAEAQRRVAAEREAAEQRFYVERLKPALLKAIADNTKKLKLGRHLVLPVLRRFGCLDEIEAILGPMSKLPESRLPQALALAVSIHRGYSLKELTPVARHFGVDVAKVRAGLQSARPAVPEKKTA